MWNGAFLAVELLVLQQVKYKMHFLIEGDMVSLQIPSITAFDDVSKQNAINQNQSKSI